MMANVWKLRPITGVIVDQDSLEKLVKVRSLRYFFSILASLLCQLSVISLHIKESRFPESDKFLLVESESWNPKSKFLCQRICNTVLESEIHGTIEIRIKLLFVSYLLCHVVHPQIASTDVSKYLFTFYAIDFDYCDPNPCQNGGSCQQRMGFHECICHEQYKGKLCERKLL